MPLFKCATCSAIENTALCNHAVDRLEGRPPVCSECATGAWHGRFPKRHAVGTILASDGFLYSPEAFAENLERFKRQKIRPIGMVQADGSTIPLPRPLRA